MDLAFEKNKKEYIQAKVEMAIEESFVHPSPFLTPDIITKKINFQTDEEINALYEKFKKGIEILLREVSTLTDEPQKSILSFFMQISSRSEKIPLEKVSELSQEEALLLYQISKKILESGQLEDASNCFLVLTQITPGAEQIWLEFGITKQKQGHFDEALVLYAQSSHLNALHPLPHLYAAECWGEHGYSEEATQALNHASILIEKDEIFAYLKPYVQSVRQKIASVKLIRFS